MSMSRNIHPIRWSVLLCTRILVAAVAFLINLVHFLFTMMNIDESSPVVRTWTPFISTMTLLIVTILLIRAKGKRLVRSGPVWVFAFVSSIASAIDYYHILVVRIPIPDYEYYIMIANLPVMVTLLFLCSFADKPVINKTADKMSPRDLCSFPGYFTYSFLNELVWNGWHGILEYKDLHGLVEMNKTKYLAPLLTKNLYKKKEDGTLVSTGVTKALIKTYYGQMFHSAVTKLLMDLTDLAPPLLLKWLLAFAMDKDDPAWHGYVIATLMLFATVANNLAQNQYFDTTTVGGIRARTGLMTCIYRKALRLGPSVRQETTIGEIVNLMSVDADRFRNLSEYIHFAWASFPLIGICIYFLYQELGYSAFAGVLVLLLVMPFNGLVAHILEAAQKKQMAKKDERVKCMNEILSGIRVIKMYGWEEAFMDIVSKMRLQEIRHISHVAYSNSVFTFMWTVTPVLISLSTFTVYVLVDESHVLDPKKVFFCLSVFNLVRMPLTNLPYLMTHLVSCYVAAKRLNKYFDSPDLVKYVTTMDESDESGDVIVMDKAVLTWITDKKTGIEDTEFRLQLDLRCKENSLIAIVGNVGSGKSSAISAILGEMQLREGSIALSAKLKKTGYVPQQAWIQNDTLRQNILFGSEYEERKYRRVVEYCQLRPDLAILPAGDQTEIGEKGINMSGGQKQRLSLARACYSDADLYLFDDPLSAVDSHVAKQLFEKVFSSKTGMLRQKTRILVTNNISVLPDVDQIFVMKNGCISESGTYAELEARKGDFSEFLEEFATKAEQKEEIQEHTRSGSEVIHMTKSGPAVDKRLRNDSVRSVVTASIGADNPKKDVLIQDETRAIGRVKWSVFQTYFSHMTTLPIFALALLGNQACEAGSNYWLSQWSNDGVDNATLRSTRVIVFAVLGLTSACCLLVASLALAKGTLEAAIKLHQNLLYRIMRSGMAFFETTPIGRIVNRFSKDMDSIDIWLMDGFLFFFVVFLQILGAIIMIELSLNYFLCIALPLFAVFFVLQRFYIATSRQLRRLDSTTRSPIYSQFSESLSGVSTIRSYGASERFEMESDSRIDMNQTCSFSTWVTNRWLSTRVQFVGNIVVFLCAVFAVWFKESVDPGTTGLAVSYSMSISNLLNWFVQTGCFVETEIVSVERVLEYSKTPSEADWKSAASAKPAANWPQNGSIKFTNYETKYREGLEPVIRNISCNLHPREKIGIVGRTGAGKSTITQALLRIIEATDGSITIDGVDIRSIGLHDLRGRLTIIPQDPVLFSGSLRTNLDPFNQKADDQLWQALRLAHLSDFVSSYGLDFVVSEGGENLSLGQRQLICLSRALLRKSKILIMDEATAAVDMETDALIQSTIRSEFADCTILTIAHRLNTIIDSDRVLVMDGGKIVEFDSPLVLMKRKDSFFHSLAQDAGLVT